MVGQSQPQRVYEILARKGELTPAQATLQTAYAEGLADYRARRWDEARAAFARALEAVPGDGPAKALIARIDTFAQNPPAEDWDGSWYLEHK